MPDRERKRRTLARKIRQVRHDHFGEDGIPRLAEELRIPPRTWMNYEDGVTIPALVILRLLAACKLDPEWLLSEDEGLGMLPGPASSAGMGPDDPIPGRLRLYEA